MSNITDLSKTYENKLIVELQKENELLKARIVELTIDTAITKEELICIQQIKILHDRSIQRELSLEEVKKLDLLVKNLKLITESITDKNSENKIRDVSEDLLVSIAASNNP